MRKNAIRLVIMAGLLLAGGSMQVRAANTPMPVPTLPPISCN
jgi:hypothetical protein